MPIYLLLVFLAATKVVPPPAETIFNNALLRVKMVFLV